jgi:hypothetical protein
MADEAEPVTTRFYRFIPGIPKPRRADRSADGMIPVRALRYCEPLASASAFGWYLYPPLNFSLMLDGNEVFWTYEGADGAYPVAEGAQFPGFRQFFEDTAPEPVKRFAPTFLGASREPGGVQIWSGYLAQTAPGWALLSRKPANIPIVMPYEQFEGILETSSWFGPLFTNIRLTRSNARVDFHMNRPLLQVQPILRECYQNPSFEVLEFAHLGEADWQRFEATMKPNANNMRNLGHYAVETRKRLHAEAAE